MGRWTLHRLRERFASDRGAFSVMIAVLMLAMIAMVLLTLDAGKRLNSISYAQDLAGETARYAAQVLTEDSLLSSDPRISPTAVAKATTWAQDRGGSAVIVQIAGDGRSVTVTLTVDGVASTTPGFTTTATATHTAQVLDRP